VLEIYADDVSAEGLNLAKLYCKKLHAFFI